MWIYNFIYLFLSWYMLSSFPPFIQRTKYYLSRLGIKMALLYYSSFSHLTRQIIAAFTVLTEKQAGQIDTIHSETMYPSVYSYSLRVLDELLRTV